MRGIGPRKTDRSLQGSSPRRVSQTALHSPSKELWQVLRAPKQRSSPEGPWSCWESVTKASSTHQLTWAMQPSAPTEAKLTVQFRRRRIKAGVHCKPHCYQKLSAMVQGLGNILIRWDIPRAQRLLLPTARQGPVLSLLCAGLSPPTPLSQPLKAQWAPFIHWVALCCTLTSHEVMLGWNYINRRGEREAGSPLQLDDQASFFIYITKKYASLILSCYLSGCFITNSWT